MSEGCQAKRPENIGQYVEDLPGLLRDLVAALKPGGLISIVSINRFSIPYRVAFLRGDLAEALAQLDARRQQAISFDATMTCYSASEAALFFLGRYRPNRRNHRCQWDGRGGRGF